MRRDPADQVGVSGVDDRRGGWPVMGRRIVSAVLLFHIAAVLAGALAASPASELERKVVGPFGVYHEATNLGQSYRYYSPAPPPTPVVTATVAFDDGRPEATVRLPDRGLSPRLRYQRHLALAHHLFVDFDEARRFAGDGGRSRWARAYARHLGKTFPGARSVALTVRFHLIPDPARVRELRAEAGSRGVNLDAEEFYTVPERIGVFPCDAS